MVMEQRMKQEEEEAITKFLIRRGYVPFWQKGYLGDGRYGIDRCNGGVGLWVHRSCKVRHLLSDCEGHAQMVVVEAAGVVFAVSYAPPGAENVLAHKSLAARVLHKCGDAFANQLWFWVSDFNDSPQDTDLAPIAEQWGGRSLAADGPSRWSSTRCIDFLFTNSPTKVFDLRYGEQAISDHKILNFEVEACVNAQKTVKRTAPTPAWSCPEGLSTAAWRACLRDAFDRELDGRLYHRLAQMLDEPAVDVDAEWDMFQRLLDSTCRNALQAHHDDLKAIVDSGDLHPAQELESLQSQLREIGKQLQVHAMKGGKAEFVKVPLSRNGTLISQSQRERKLRNWRGRAQACLAWLQGGKSWEDILVSSPKMLKRLWKTDPLPETAGDACIWLKRRLDETDRLLTAEIKHNQHQRFAQWSKRMKAGIKEVGKWVRAKRTPPAAPFVKYDDSQSQTASEAAGLILQFWQDFWKGRKDLHEVAKRQDIVDFLADSFGQFLLPGPWDPPDAKLLCKRARMARGAAGLDGWRGEEISQLPEDVFALFAVLGQRWHVAQRVPLVLCEGRQVSIPKANKVTKGNVVNAGDVRPIGVLSAWWRLWAGAWLRTEKFVQWQAQALHPDMAGAHNRQSAEEVVARLFSDIGCMQFGGSLDFSNCYDLLAPDVTAAVLQRIGMPGEVAKTFGFQWANTTRFVEFGNTVSSVPLDASTACAQGDPWGPFILAVWISAGLRFVQTNSRTVDDGVAACLPRAKRQRTSIVAETRHSAYMDDRSWAANTARECVRTATKWSSWAKRVGLRENAAKTQLMAIGSSAAKELQAEAEKEGLGKAVADTLEVLGATSAFSRRGLSDKETKRLNRAKDAIRLVGALPLARAQRVIYLQVFATSIGKYGWTSRGPPAKAVDTFGTAAWRTLDKMAASAKQLRMIVEGSGLELDIASICALAVALLRMLSRPDARTDEAWNGGIGTPGYRLRNWLDEHGWLAIEPWRWFHDGLNKQLFLIKGVKDEVAHLLRASWRHKKWREFTNTERRDAIFLKDCIYEESRMELAKRLAGYCAIKRIVLEGGVRSPAFMAASNAGHKFKTGCIWGCGETGHWLHIAWQCERRESDLAQPSDPLQARFGWPRVDLPKEYNRNVLDHLANTAIRIWQDRHRCAPIDKLVSLDEPGSQFSDLDENTLLFLSERVKHYDEVEKWEQEARQQDCDVFNHVWAKEHERAAFSGGGL
eukprot:TRINITY_DN29052_c0_g1_i4.p1 TRINITY_DN29052_c0_g1~~TRINITY_DN29052_c0_g1_i4.p1  ORF type:complete len:1215 (+),score=102.46 TRINITY_DN29052_c0_g1_i4:4302-7946(+)